MEHGLTPMQATVCSSSEFRVGTDAESTTNPAGSSIVKALDVKCREPYLDRSDTDSTFTPVRLPATSRDYSFRPSSRSLIHEYFSNIPPSSFPEGHQTIAFTEGQFGSVLTVEADKTEMSSYDMLDSLIRRASELNLGLSTSRNVSPAKCEDLEVRGADCEA